MIAGKALLLGLPSLFDTIPYRFLIAVKLSKLGSLLDALIA